MMATLEERLVRVETVQDEHGRSIRDMRALVEGVSKIAYNLETVQSGVNRIEGKVDDLDCRLDAVEQRPAKASLGAWKYIGLSVASYILGQIMPKLL